MLFAFGLLLFFSIFTGLAIYFFKYKHMIDVTKNLPSPPSLPIIGHGHYFIAKPAHRIVQLGLDFNKMYGNAIKVWLGPELNILINDVKDIETVMSQTRFNDKADAYGTLDAWLREGLLVSRGKKWHQRRKVITPAFHFKILNQFIEVFQHQSQFLLANLDKELKMQTKEGCNLYDLINLYTLDTICESAMGVSVNAQTNADSDYVKAVKTISKVLHKRMFDVFYRFNLTYKFTKLALEEKRALAVLHGFSEKIIVQRRAELIKIAEAAAGNAAVINDAADIGSKRKLAFLDILLQSEIDGKPLSNLDIREEVDTFIFEGHDTTSSAITFFFYKIALNPKCQQKCFEEVLAIFGSDKEKPATYEDLNRMHYIELCIKETLRLYPSVPILGRKVTEECVINGKTIPAGTNIGITPLHLGRLDSLFPNAAEFIPERFDVVTSADKMSPYAYIPFSAGPRNCIGQKFAMLEIKSVVSKMLRHYEIEYAGDPTVEPVLIAELILRTKEPIMFRIKPRIY